MNACPISQYSNTSLRIVVECKYINLTFVDGIVLIIWLFVTTKNKLIVYIYINVFVLFGTVQEFHVGNLIQRIRD